MADRSASATFNDNAGRVVHLGWPARALHDDHGREQRKACRVKCGPLGRSDGTPGGYCRSGRDLDALEIGTASNKTPQAAPCDYRASLDEHRVSARDGVATDPIPLGHFMLRRQLGAYRPLALDDAEPYGGGKHSRYGQDALWVKRTGRKGETWRHSGQCLPSLSACQPPCMTATAHKRPARSSLLKQGVTRWPGGAESFFSTRSRGRAGWLRSAIHVAVQPDPS
jgi:hypothetical protein